MKINVDMIYPIGSLYLTTSTISPATLFGGTWTRLTSDAYLKIVNTDVELGQLGGTSSDHKIPLTSIPKHDHYLWQNPSAGGGSGTWEGLAYVVRSALTNNGATGKVSAAGGGQAYYPYYYGIYVWKRTA